VLVLYNLLMNYQPASGQSGGGADLPVGIRELNTSDALERMLAEEAARLDRAIGFSTPIRITNGDIEAKPQLGILINKKDIQNYLDKSQVHQMRDVIRVVLAHEKAHWVQFRDPRYGFQILRWDLERKRIMECQADIIAGKYWREAFGIESFKRLEANPLTSETASGKPQFYAKDILQLAFDLGKYETNSNSGKDTHPSRQSRRVAFRLGMAIGGLDFANREIERLYRQPASADRDQLIQMYRGSMNITMYKTQFYPQQRDVLDWSYWQASRIVHYSSTASKDISVTVIREKWSRDPKRPYVTYSISFQNTGTRPIRSDFAIQCDAFPKEDRQNTKESLLIDSKSYRFTLQPNEKRTVRDSLMIALPNDVDASQYVTVLTLPPMPTSLMRFEYADGQAPDEGNSSQSAEFATKSTEPIKNNLLPILTMYLGETKNGFRKLVAGPSIRYLYEVDTDRVVRYGFTPYENLIETKIISSASNRYPPYVAVTLFQTLSAIERRNFFADLSRRLGATQGLTRVPLTDGTDPDQVALFSYVAADDYYVALAWIKDPNSRYEVMLVIRPKPKP
jgi:hypothetical protein